MRSSLFYGVILLCCLIIATVQADKKWKVYETEDDKIRKKDIDITQKKLEKVKTNKNRNSKFINAGSSEESDEENHKKSINKVETDSSTKGKGKKPQKQIDESFSSEETFSSKSDKNEDKKGNDPPPQKKFIGRIEHGKVMVLRIKEDPNKNNNHSEQSEEDHKAKVCRKIKGGKKVDCENGDAEVHDGSNEEDTENKSRKKIKYSIKFQHEKQKKKESNGDIGIMRMHRNGKRHGISNYVFCLHREGYENSVNNVCVGKYLHYDTLVDTKNHNDLEWQHDDDGDDDNDNSSHEDDSPFKKRISYDDDD